MGYIPDYENDIFISYSHIDNQPLTDGQIGWITNFHRSLETRLAQVLGEPPQVWRDPKLKGNDYFDETIVEQFPKVAILLSVLTPRYIQSDWCLKELREFCCAAEKKGGLRVEAKSRILKVVKTPVPREKSPAELQSLLGYDFYRLDAETGRPREFRQEIVPEKDLNYWNKLDDLVYDIRDFFEIIKAHKTGTEVKAATCCIYLAETTSDLSIERDKIRRELQQRGYQILPDQPLPIDAEELQEAIRHHLSCSKLSIHLIGPVYGMIPEGETRSIVHLQNALAAEKSIDPSFCRLIWMPVGLQPKEARQQEYIQHLQYDQEALRGAELLQTSLEDLKAIIYDKLNSSQKSRTVPIDMQGPNIYLVCDERDFDATRPLTDYLFKTGFEVLLPAFKGEERQVRQAHQENLLRCDGVLIYYGHASDSWLNIKMADLQKIFGYGRSKPLKTKAIYICPPETIHKQRLQTRDMLLIRCQDEFTPSVLNEFVDQLRNGKGDPPR